MGTSKTLVLPRVIESGLYTARISEESPTPWGPQTKWTIMRDVVEVGSLSHGYPYEDRTTASLNKLVWSGDWPRGTSDPRSPHYGICFDIGPQATPETALAKLIESAERLIAWRKAQTP
jgi:hypothetical protein